MPSLMRHVGVAPMWVLRLLDAVWVGMAVALICVVVRMVRLLRREGLRPAA
jgi:MFS superfamily sulfate permease-like transporter